MNLISIVIPTLDEEDNIEGLIAEITNQFLEQKYDYEIIVIDNCSGDNTVKKVKNLIEKNKKIKLIVNSRNFGHLRSPFYGILQARGDAVILINADFQDPPRLIGELINKWKTGCEIVLLQKIKSDENKIKFFIRNMFYKILNSISENKMTTNTTGSGIFDKKIINQLKKINDPYPYFRGLLSEIGPKISLLEFKQPERKHGKTKNNFFTLYDLGMLGLVKHSKIPLRLMTISGLIISLVSLAIALIFFILKLFNWYNYSIGIAPMLIGIFAFGGFQLFFLGLLGEYIIVILQHVRNLPLVIEKERINFDD
ncbi:glycosyltransferase family 2 protein [Candidatus Pelagibacter sp.]|jgi:polyisoprenyl-phosphate glycosyltransferase|nr:glycosyltransferase family 2 protein [Candidatus Pelagibacter sp.]